MGGAARVLDYLLNVTITTAWLVDYTRTGGFSCVETVP